MDKVVHTGSLEVFHHIGRITGQNEHLIGSSRLEGASEIGRGSHVVVVRRTDHHDLGIDLGAFGPCSSRIGIDTFRQDFKTGHSEEISGEGSEPVRIAGFP